MSIRPAIEVLRELDGKNFLDKLALSLHTAAGDVIALGKPAKIIITLTIDQFSSKGMIEPVLTVEADINEKFPKPDPNLALFYADADGNMTVNQQRQRDLGLSIADAQPREEQHGR
jgi:hypothetical protein